MFVGHVRARDWDVDPGCGWLEDRKGFSLSVHQWTAKFKQDTRYSVYIWR